MTWRYEWRDVATRVLLVVAGGVAAILLAMKGELAALPGLALGGTLGACFVTRIASDR